MFDRFDIIRVINLPERTDRRADMLQELRRVGLDKDSRVEFFEAVKPEQAYPWRKIGEHGCFMSHLRILEEAAGKGQSVLLLEDDADFTRAALKPQPHVDVLWGGYWLTADWIQGTHCIGFSANAAALAVPFLQEMMQRPSPAPIDGAYHHFLKANPDLPAHYSVPVVAVQRPSVSDIAGARGFDRYPIARPVMAMLRMVKREWQRR